MNEKYERLDKEFAFENKLKIIYMWVKQGVINQKMFISMIEYAMKTSF